MPRCPSCRTKQISGSDHCSRCGAKMESGVRRQRRYPFGLGLLITVILGGVAGALAVISLLVAATLASNPREVFAIPSRSGFSGLVLLGLLLGALPAGIVGGMVLELLALGVRRRWPRAAVCGLFGLILGLSVAQNYSRLLKEPALAPTVALWGLIAGAGSALAHEWLLRRLVVLPVLPPEQPG